MLDVMNPEPTAQRQAGEVQPRRARQHATSDIREVATRRADASLSLDGSDEHIPYLRLRVRAGKSVFPIPRHHQADFEPWSSRDARLMPELPTAPENVAYEFRVKYTRPSVGMN